MADARTVPVLRELLDFSQTALTALLEGSAWELEGASFIQPRAWLSWAVNKDITPAQLSRDTSEAWGRGVCCQPPEMMVLSTGR